MLVEHLGQAEVHQHDRPVRVQLDIGWLDVPMDDRRRAGVQVGQRAAQGIRPPQDLIYRWGAMLGMGVEIYPFDVVHHQVLAVLVDEVVGHAWQIGMAQAGEQRSLAVELALRLRVDVEIFLDRHPDLKGFIRGQIDGTHAALAEHAFDAIAMMEEGAGFKRHRCEIVKALG